MDKSNNEEMEQDEQVQQSEIKEEVSREAIEALMMSILKEIGCQPTYNDQTKCIEVAYQGERFELDCPSPYIRIWDMGWTNIYKDDPLVNLAFLAVNEANYNYGTTVTMTPPDQNGLINIHTHHDIVMFPNFPRKAAYIKEVLDTFFTAKETVRSTFNRLREQQQSENQNKPNPIGFMPMGEA
jgi:hypothetical protein